MTNSGAVDSAEADGPGWSPNAGADREGAADSATRAESAGSTAGARPELSVVVPAYNEAASIARTVGKIVAAVGEGGYVAEVIVVNDGSDDRTVEELSSLAEALPTVRVVSYDDNQGKGHAVKIGCQRASGELVLFVDGDGELTPEGIRTFIERLETAEADIVIGSKRHPDSTVRYPVKRRLLSKGYSLLIRLLFGLDVTDTQVGFKLFRREIVDEVMPLVLVHRYAFDMELLVLAHDRGYVIAEAPVSLDFDGRSSVNWREVCRIALDTARVFVRHNLHSYELIERYVLQYDRDNTHADHGGNDQ